MSEDNKALLILPTEDVLKILALGVREYLGIEVETANHVEINGASGRIWFEPKKEKTR